MQQGLVPPPRASQHREPPARPTDPPVKNTHTPFHTSPKIGLRPKITEKSSVPVADDDYVDVDADDGDEYVDMGAEEGDDDKYDYEVMEHDDPCTPSVSLKEKLLDQVEQVEEKVTDIKKMRYVPFKSSQKSAKMEEHQGSVYTNVQLEKEENSHSVHQLYTSETSPPVADDDSYYNVERDDPQTESQTEDNAYYNVSRVDPGNQEADRYYNVTRFIPNTTSK